MTQRFGRKNIKTDYDSLQSSTRELALQVIKGLGLRISHEPSEMFLKNTNILQEWLEKTPTVSTKEKKRDYDLLSNTFHFLRSTGMKLFS